MVRFTIEKGLDVRVSRDEVELLLDALAERQVGGSDAASIIRDALRSATDSVTVVIEQRDRATVRTAIQDLERQHDSTLPNLEFLGRLLD